MRIRQLAPVCVMPQNRWEHTATRLLSGQVLVAGGDNVGTSAELFTPAAPPAPVPAIPGWALVAMFAGICAAPQGLRRRRVAK
jgi:hypothetical protein